MNIYLYKNKTEKYQCLYTDQIGFTLLSLFFLYLFQIVLYNAIRRDKRRLAT